MDKTEAITFADLIMIPNWGLFALFILIWIDKTIKKGED